MVRTPMELAIVAGMVGLHWAISYLATVCGVGVVVDAILIVMKPEHY